MASNFARSMGGRAPRRVIGLAADTFLDHTGQTVTAVHERRTTVSPPPRLSLHLYTLSPDFVESPEDIGKAFLLLPGIVSGNGRTARVDVYTPLQSVEECMQHHEAEKEYRQSNGGLHIVPTWQKMSMGYVSNPWKNVIFVIGNECRCWQDVLDKGLLGVRFDQDMPFQAKIQVYEEDDSENEAEEGLVEVQDCGPDPKTDQISLRHYRQVFDSEYGFVRNVPDNPPGTILLNDYWAKLTSCLRQCTYQWEHCDTCFEDKPHDDCETIKDRHYYDDDGRCIQCTEDECEMGHGQPWYMR